MRTAVALTLLLVTQVAGQVQTNPQNGIVEFYTTQSAGPALAVYSDDQRLGEVTLNQVVRFSGTAGTYRFGLTPDAPPLEQVTVSLRDGQHLYLRVTRTGFYLGNAAEAVRLQSARAVANSTTVPAANAANAQSPSVVAANIDASGARQNATIFFYRDWEGSSQHVTIYSLFVWGSRPVAALEKGEYFALSVSPGTNAFSWVPAPAKGQSLVLDVTSGQQIFLKVQPSGFSPTPRTSFQDLHGVASLRTFDKARVNDEPATAPNRTVANRPSEQTLPQIVAEQRAWEPGNTYPINIRGYVTEARLPTAFKIDDYQIIRDEDVTIQFENGNPGTQFNIENITVGTALDVKGDLDEQTKVILAKSIKVDLDQFRTLKNTVVLASTPTGLVRSTEGWNGTLFADGQRIRVASETKVVLKLSPEQAGDSNPQVPINSLREITPGMFMTYEGIRDVESGAILADTVEFSRNDFEKGEQVLWNKSMVRFKGADTLNLRRGGPTELGELSVPDVGKFKLVPNEQVQEYVSQIGKSLIPKYALAIAQTDPLKFRFQFYVVVNNEPTAFALPTGVFVIYSGLFSVLENEAQLAAVIGHEMAHVLQEHQWRAIQQSTTLKAGLGVTVFEAFGRRTLKGVLGLTDAAIRGGYAPDQENQADRLALEYMTNAGYDPREAPRVWAAIAKAAGSPGKNSFYNSNESRVTRRSYLLNLIRHNYSNLNFADFRTEETAYKRMTVLANEAVSGKVETFLQGKR
jgi:hypothetical protein